MFTTLTLAGSSLDRHDGHGHTFKRDDSLYAIGGQFDGLASAMRSYNPIANAVSGPILAPGEKLVGWAGYHHVARGAAVQVPHYLPH